MNLMTRFKLWRAAKRMAKSWREATGGSCRYSFRVGGSVMQFSGPECETDTELAELLRGAANMLEAPKANINLDREL